MLTRCGQAGLTVFLSGSRVGHWGLILLLAGILGSMIVFVLLFYLNNKHGFEEAESTYLTCLALRRIHTWAGLQGRCELVL